jgi:hypothetical protein
MSSKDVFGMSKSHPRPPESLFFLIIINYVLILLLVGRKEVLSFCLNPLRHTFPQNMDYTIHIY